MELVANRACYFRNTSSEVSRLTRMGGRISGDKMGGERGGIVVAGRLISGKWEGEDDSVCMHTYAVGRAVRAK